jgi:poly(3-hydroxyalkanoate) synthetase
MENKVLEMLDYMADDDMENVEGLLDLDLGYWNADDGPAMSREVYTQIVKDCSDEELSHLYEMMMFGG